ncbi:MAG: nucleotidyltransferase domain-containing protein [Myxococcota bacterium]
MRKIEADLERERAEAEALRARVLPPLRAVIGRLRGEGRCGEVWLFGSFAWGAPTPRSDVDLLVADADDVFAVAGDVAAAVGRDVLAIPFEDAPESLRQRALADGLAL